MAKKFELSSDVINDAVLRSLQITSIALVLVATALVTRKQKNARQSIECIGQ